MGAAIYPQTIKGYEVKILPADASNLKTLVTGGTNGTRVEMIMATSTDTVNRDLQFVLTVGGVDYIIDTVTCTANGGTVSSTAATNIMGHATKFLWCPTDAAGNRYMYVENGAVLKVKSLATVTAAKEITVYAHGGDF